MYPIIKKRRDMYTCCDVYELYISELYKRKVKYWRLSITWWLFKLVWFPTKPT